MGIVVRRFEQHDRGVVDRAGINPFTKKSITIKGRPPRTVCCEIGIDGNTVLTSWSWFELAVCTAGPHCQTETFADHAAAANHAIELADDLLTDGFRETDARAALTDERRRVINASSTECDPKALAAAIVAHCHERAWFGSDMTRDSASARAAARKRFEHAPATTVEIAETERVLGFALPPLLREIYSTVANGGFGPGYGFIGAVGGAPTDWADDIADAYRIDRDPSPRVEESDCAPGEPGWFEPFQYEWPGRVVRLVDWGCTIWSCLDVRRGRVLRYEALHGKNARASMIVEAASLESWVERWVRGEESFQRA